MFGFIEMFGFLCLLFFIANFVHYIFWTVSGEEGPTGFVFAMSTGWIKTAKQKKEVAEATEQKEIPKKKSAK
jgi:hypothetical protein